MSIHIIGNGSYLPQKIVFNSELEQKLGLDEGWISQRTGIKQRHELGDEDFITSAVIAAKKAIGKAEIDLQDIDLIILATVTPQKIMPSSAILVQRSLGIEQCISFDIQAACSGFVYALSVAESFMKTNGLRNAIVMGCEAFSRILDRSDPVTSVLFGDGFGAVVLKNEENHDSGGILYTHCGTDTVGFDLLEVPWGIGQGVKTLEKISPYIVMNGREVFKYAVHYFSEEIELALRKCKISIDDLSFIVTHQANVRIVQAVCEKLKISIDKFFVTLPFHGNTSAASIPLALDCLMEEKELRGDEYILLTGFGAGFTWGTVLFQLSH